MPAKKKSRRKKTKEYEITPGKIIIALALIAALVYLARFPLSRSAVDSTPPSAEPAEVLTGFAEWGNVISVDYVGRFKRNNTVFDTSLANVALEEGIFDSKRSYAPLKIIIGRGQVIPGFEAALLGMRVGEKKTIEIPPEKAYGEYDPALVVEVNRTQKINRVIPVAYKRFVGAFSDEPVVGDAYVADESSWPLKVLSVVNQTVYVEQLAEVGVTFKGMFGEATVVDVSGDFIYVREDPTAGQVVFSDYGALRVLDFNDTIITTDLNHPLAGETLVFELTVRDLMK